MHLPPHENDRTLLPNERESLYATMKEAVVKIDVRHDDQKIRIRSGVVIDSKGLILTAGTTFRANSRTTFIVITFDGRRLACCKSEGNDDLGLFLLKPLFVSKSKPLVLPYAELAENGPHVGSDIHCISHAQELTYSFFSGRISHQDRAIEGILMEDDKIGKDVKICSGQHLNQAQGLLGDQSSEGAPVFNNQGKIVGIYAFGGLNFDFIFSLDSLKDLTQLAFQSSDDGGSSGKVKHLKSSLVQRGKSSAADDTEMRNKRKRAKRCK